MVKRTKAQISHNMSRIKSRGTSIEKIFRRALRKAGIGFRGDTAKIFGKPDLILHGKKIAIFCDSAFWHGYRFGKTNTHNFKRRRKFWEEKILGNIRRDKVVNFKLKTEGWKVLRFWDFKIEKDLNDCLRQVKEKIRNEK